MCHFQIALGPASEPKLGLNTVYGVAALMSYLEGSLFLPAPPPPPIFSPGIQFKLRDNPDNLYPKE